MHFDDVKETSDMGAGGGCCTLKRQRMQDVAEDIWMWKKKLQEQTKIAKVWHIENNELTCKNKKVISINFNDIEISILKEEREFYAQDFLIKDKNNEYWKLGIAPIKVQLFASNESLEKEEQTRVEEYKRDITNAYKNIDLKVFWQKKIEQNKYF